MTMNHLWKKKLFEGLQYLYAAVIIIFCIFPFSWMLSTSFKSQKDIFTSPPRFITSDMTLNNYVNAIEKNNLLLYTKNSLIITVSTVILTIVIATLAAFAMGYLKLRGTKILTSLLVSLQMLPVVIAIIPLYIICGKMGILNTYKALVLSYLGSSVPIAVILLTGFFVDVPADLGEAAMIDGCNIWQSFCRVILPVSIPGIISGAIYTFIRIWQEFIIALSFTTNKKMYTLTIGLRAYEGYNQTDWGGLMATAVVISIPAIILFVLVQKQFMDSLSGSVKG